MAKMSWQYIAGFFDGEGSVGLYKSGGLGNRRFGLSIPQSEQNDGLNVLTQIRDFLVSEGMTIKGLGMNRSPMRRGYKPIHQIQLNKLESLRLFLEGVMPYVVVKKVVVQDILRYLKIYPSMLSIRLELKKSMGRWAKPLVERSVIEMKILRAIRGLTYVELGKRYGVPTSTARAACIGQNWKHLLPFTGDNRAYQQYYPNHQFTI